MPALIPNLSVKPVPMQRLPRAVGKKISLLLADDDPLVRAAVSVLVTRERNITIVGEATNGEEAVAMASDLEPDVVLLDLNMPKSSGLDALRQMSSFSLPRKIILLTVAIDKPHLLEALQTGARGVVLKSAARMVLVDAVREVAGGGYWVDQNPVGDLPALVQTLKKEAFANGSRATRLTPKELRIVTFIVEGRTNKDIAQTLLTSEQVVKNHMGKIFDKVGVFNRLELALYALDHKLAQRP